MVVRGVDIMPLLIFGGMIGMIFYLSKKRLGEKTFAAGRVAEKEESLASFDDIGGQDVAKGELREALEFLTDTCRIKSLGIRPLKGILLNGPPGTGKTLLAKAAAKFTGAAFISASGSEFVEMYVGVGAQRVRQLFKQAKTLAKQNNTDNAVIFVDEIEVLGGRRGANSGHLEYDQTLNELLVQMDGLSSDDDVRILIIGATNRADMLDAALLRPGRFDRQVNVDLPDKKGRLHILKLHTKNKPLADDVCLENIAADTFGFSGAHLESLANEAAILAFREGGDKITEEHLRSSVEKVIMGEKLDRTPTTEEKRRIAVHEAGHALLSEYTKSGAVASITISSRGKALGYVRNTQEDDVYLYTLDHLRGKIAVAVAGAAAEEMHIGHRSTGSANDFKHAAEMAKQIVHSGMSSLGIVSPEDLPKEVLHQTISGIMQEAETYAKTVLGKEKNVKILKKTIDILISKERISGDEFREIVRSLSA
jgi:ATP-dependent metalloprotease FtsH